MGRAEGWARRCGTDKRWLGEAEPGLRRGAKQPIVRRGGAPTAAQSPDLDALLATSMGLPTSSSLMAWTLLSLLKRENLIFAPGLASQDRCPSLSLSLPSRFLSAALPLTLAQVAHSAHPHHTLFSSNTKLAHAER